MKCNTDIAINEETNVDIKFLVKRFTDDANRVCSERSNQSLYNTLRKLSNDPQIKARKVYKKNEVAILESEYFYAKLDKMVNDKIKFVEIWIFQ